MDSQGWAYGKLVRDFRSALDEVGEPRRRSAIFQEPVWAGDFITRLSHFFVPSWEHHLQDDALCTLSKSSSPWA